jgi:hypothetical protein
MTEDGKYPLSWRQRRTPKRQTRRARNWRKIYPGYHFEGTAWVVCEGPWRKIRKSGTLAYVRVLCSEEHGGCGKEYDRMLNTIIRGDSHRCIECCVRDMKQNRHTKRYGQGKGQGQGQGLCKVTSPIDSTNDEELTGA